MRASECATANGGISFERVEELQNAGKYDDCEYLYTRCLFHHGGDLYSEASIVICRFAYFLQGGNGIL